MALIFLIVFCRHAWGAMAQFIQNTEKLVLQTQNTEMISVPLKKIANVLHVVEISISDMDKCPCPRWTRWTTRWKIEDFIPSPTSLIFFTAKKCSRVRSLQFTISILL